MAANIEHEILCKIVEQQDFHTVEKLKIDESFFLSDSQTKEVFRFIREHFHNEHTYGSVPSWALLQTRFYGFPWVYSYDTLPTLCQELRRNKMRVEIQNVADEAMQLADTDPGAAFAVMRETVTRMSSSHEITNDMLLSGAVEQIQADYDMLANAHGLTGIPYPWQILNDDTQGMQPGQFIIIYGRPKSMKTWIALCIAVNAYMKGMRVLVWSLEMSEMQLLRRIVSIIAKIDYDAFKKSKLDPATLARVWQILLSIKDEELLTNVSGHTSSLMVTSPRGDSSGVSALQAKIREFNPDLVVVDGMYLMRDDRQKVRSIDWKSVAHVSQDLKGTARIFNVPVIGVTQANRGADKDPKKADLAELAYADALAQDCDLCLRVNKQKDQSTNDFEIVISIPGGRETLLDGFVVHGMAGSNFDFKRATFTDPAQQGQPQTQQQGGGQKQSKQNHPHGPPVLPQWGKKN